MEDTDSVPNARFKKEIDAALLSEKKGVQVTKLIAICIGNSDFSMVVKDGKQAMADLPNCLSDASRMSSGLKHLQFKTRMHQELTGQDLENLSDQLLDEAHSNPEEKFLFWFYFSGHGLNRGGIQHVLLNEKPGEDGSLKTFNSENMLRKLAENDNCRVVAVHDCCREKMEADTRDQEQHDAQNLIQIYGCPPGLGVSADSNISEDLIKMMQDDITNDQNRDNALVVFPDVLENQIKKFESVEMVGTFTEKVVLQFKDF